MPEPSPSPDASSDNVETVAELHARAQHDPNPHQRTVEFITAALGRPRSVYTLLSLVVFWTGSNLVLRHLHGKPFDPPPFYWLQGLIGLLALLLTTVVLVTQNRLGRTAERRALLDLHVNLLVERKVAKLIALIEELRRDLPQVHNRRDENAEAMSHPIDPHQTVANLEHSIEQRIGNVLQEVRQNEADAEVARGDDEALGG